MALSMTCAVVMAIMCTVAWGGPVKPGDEEINLDVRGKQ